MTNASRPSERLRLGLVGFGAGARLVLNSLTGEGRFDLVGAADTDSVVRAAFSEQWGAPAYHSLDELAENVPLDAVYIATPTKYHEEQAIAALDAGFAVLVEKPMALTIESSLAMIEASTRNKKPLLENHKRSFDRPIITIWKLTEAGLLGRVRAVHRWHFGPWFYRPRAEEERDHRTGGVVLRQGAHEFDIIRLLANAKPTRLWGWTGDYDHDRPGEGSYQAMVEFENGVRATSIYSGYDHFDTNEFTLGLADPRSVGLVRRQALEYMGADEGAIKRRMIGPQKDASPSRDSNVYGFTLVNGEHGDARPSAASNILLYGPEGRVEYAMDGPSGTDLIAREFYDAITGGIPPLHDGRWGLAVLDMCLAVRRSNEAAGLPVELEYQHDIPDATIAGAIGDRELVRCNPATG